MSDLFYLWPVFREGVPGPTDGRKEEGQQNTAGFEALRKKSKLVVETEAGR